MFKLVRVNSYEFGLKFVRNKLVEVLKPGLYVAKSLFGERIDVVSELDVFLKHKSLEEIVRSGFLSDQLEILDLKDNHRALLWIDGRFEAVIGVGLQAVWKSRKKIAIEKIEVDDPLFTHRQKYKIASSESGREFLEILEIEKNTVGLFYKNGRFVKEFESGFYAFWRNVCSLSFVLVSLQEKMFDMVGQEIITSDKVSLRLNATVSYKVVDAKKSVAGFESVDSSLYREGQLVLRAAIGSQKLDEILSEKETISEAILSKLKEKAVKFGVQINSFGIRDIILPGDMRELMNKVVAAQKEAEASQIARREETASTRSQCNTAKVLENNPTLMRLRELEAVERIAEKSNVNLFVGEKGLAEKLVGML